MVLMYTSKIRFKNGSRVNFNTTLSENLLSQIKVIAKSKDTSYNFLLEDGMVWVLENYYLRGSFRKPDRPEDRVRINTTFDKSLFNRIKARTRRFGKDVHANDLIEEGMKYIIDQHK